MALRDSSAVALTTPPDGCHDYQVQFYCTPSSTQLPAESPPALPPYTLPPRLMKRHVKIILSQAPVVPTQAKTYIGHNHIDNDHVGHDHIGVIVNDSTGSANWPQLYRP